MAGVVYQVPCKDYPCEKIMRQRERERAQERECTREREREIERENRDKEHQHDVRSLEQVKFTQARKKDSVSEVHPSAITYHIIKNNHTIDWEGVKFPSRDCDTTKRGVWEATAIQTTGSHAMNDDGGCHQLPPCNRKLLSCDASEQLIRN